MKIQEVTIEGYQSHTNSTLRGNQPIAEYYLNDDSVITKLEKPDYDRGGGKIDIIALALRLAVGEMEGVDGPLFLDEVGKHLLYKMSLYLP